MSTKKELEDQVSILKDEIRKLRSEAKSTTAELDGLSDEAYGISLEGKEFKLVKVKFDAESNKAAIEEVKNIGTILSIASSSVKHAVIDSLIALNKRRG